MLRIFLVIFVPEVTWSHINFLTEILRDPPRGARLAFQANSRTAPAFKSHTHTKQFVCSPAQGRGRGTVVLRGVRMHGYAFARPEADVPRRGRGLFQQKKTCDRQ